MSFADKIEAFVWDARFDTGVVVVDEQHRKLVDLINRLGTLSARLASTAELGTILEELKNYTVYHFGTEEDLMRQYGIDAAHQQAHIKAHRHFTEQVTMAGGILLNSPDTGAELVASLLKYLTNWLVQHILGADKRMSQELLALQAGDSQAEAVRKADAVMSQSANVLLDALNEMYGRLGDKTLEVMQKNQELQAERAALRALNEELEQRVRQRTAALEQANQQLLQSEKLAAIGQLAAGVAHEINNPVGFVNSNLGTLGRYIAALYDVIAAYEGAEVRVGGALCSDVAQVKQAVDFDYLREDIPNLLKESQQGLARVTRIVQDLKDFSHVDETTWQFANLEQALDSVLNVVANELKYKAQVVREYAGLPPVECMPSQIGQVFMNLLVNAAQAIEQKGVITVRTGSSGNEVWVEVADTGKGIAPEHLGRIFDPFFTTKPVGKGTGLGLSLSYGIIQKHHGRIEVASEPGKGARFRVWLPLQQAAAARS